MTITDNAPAVLMLATVALADPDVDTDTDRISVDEIRDEQVVDTPFTFDVPADEIETADWDDILAAAGWTVTTAWIDHGGYWCAHVQRAVVSAA